MRKIADYNFNEEATIIARTGGLYFRKTTTGADYATMLLFDGEETIEGKVWNLTDEIRAVLKGGEVYVIGGRMKEYQGKKQLNISQMRLITAEDDIDLKAFYQFAPLSAEQLQAEITGYINRIDNKILKTIVTEIIKDHYTEFFEYPAGMAIHHDYYYGLAYHVYSMLRLADAYLAFYPIFNKDLVYTGVIVHDVGKVIELTGPKGTQYTKRGNLLGHISIGANFVYEKASSLGYLETEEVTNLLHIVLSHHGKLEFGSPKEPRTPEALLVHYLDYVDSRFAGLTKALDKTAPGEFTGLITALDRASFYKPDLDN